MKKIYLKLALLLSMMQLAVSCPSSHKVILNWNASTTSGVVYKVYRGASSGGPYSNIASNIQQLTYTDDPVPSGVTIYYVVTATKGNLESAYSNEIRLKIP